LDKFAFKLPDFNDILRPATPHTLLQQAKKPDKSSTRVFDKVIHLELNYMMAVKKIVLSHPNITSIRNHGS
jgi:hypothetical protein